MTVKITVPVSDEHIYDCSLWLINYHLPRGGAIVFALGEPRQIGRLVKNMANLRQDRVPAPTLSHVSVPGAQNGAGAAPRSIVLSLRLRTGDSSGSGADVSWTVDSPAAALCLDVLSASGGAPDPPQGTILPVRYFNLQSAILAARRLQWAMQGLAESAGSTIAPAIAIHPVDDPDGEDSNAALATAAPGQILVRANIAQAMQQLPGFSIGPAGNGNWRSLEGRAAGTRSDVAADEQSLLGFMRALGREDPLAPKVEPAHTVPVPAAPVTGTYQPPEGLGRTHAETEAVPAPNRMKWLIVGGAAAVVVVVAALVIPRIVSGSHANGSSQIPGQNPAPSSGPPAPVSAPAPTPVNPSSSDKPRASKTFAKSGKPQKTEAQAEATSEPQAPPKASAGSCDLTEADIPRSLSRAESLMYAGKLAESQAAYQRVLGCPSAHEKALEGLQRVKQRMATQGSSGP